MYLTKHHGLGNDFLVVLDRENGRHGAHVDGALASRLCDRRRGIGADGLIHGARPDPERDGDVDLVMHLFNADGSRAEMSGNGIRCLAQAFLMSEEVHDAVLHVATDAGVRRVQVHESPDYRFATISVDMGVPAAGPTVPGPVEEAMEGRFGTVDMGNPHLVVLVDDPDLVDVATHGAWLDEQFQGGINVEFVATGPDPDQLRLRVWERGAGVTEACGTGACAAAHLARSWGLVGDRVGVHMPGGHAEVVFDGEHVTLVGPASHVATVELPDA